MIRLPDITLPARQQSWLKRFQQEIDDIPDYEQRVAQAIAKFKARSGNKTFQVVRFHLAQIGSGLNRCGYCEDSEATAIEHIRPKALYPDWVFVWENYLYACSKCNNCKQDKFAVFPDDTEEYVSVERRKGNPVVAPVSGDVVFINPRSEDPLQFIHLDITNDTFRFVPKPLLSARDRRRAEYTIDLLQLNRRDILVEARKLHYHSYRRWLSDYKQRRNNGEPQELLHDEFVAALKNMNHHTVWQEMKRQRDLIPELQRLFADAPEAVQW